MRTSKLLELVALLRQYAVRAPHGQQLMAQSLARAVENVAKAQERIAEIEESCEPDC